MWHPAAALSEQVGIGDVFTVKTLGYRADFADAVGFHSEKPLKPFSTRGAKLDVFHSEKQVFMLM